MRHGEARVARASLAFVVRPVDVVAAAARCGHVDGKNRGEPDRTANDAGDSISDWVERGVTPSRLTAQTIANGTVTRSRPLCLYPQRVVYSGSGSTDDEKTFVSR